MVFDKKIEMGAILGVAVVAIIALLTYAIVALKRYLVLIYAYALFEKRRLIGIGVVLLIFIGMASWVGMQHFDKEEYVNEQVEKIKIEYNAKIDEIIRKENEIRRRNFLDAESDLPETRIILTNQDLRRQYGNDYLTKYNMSYDIPQDIIKNAKLNAYREIDSAKNKASLNKKRGLFFVLGMFFCFSLLYFVRTVMNVGFWCAVPAMVLQYIAAILLVTFVMLIIYVISGAINNREKKRKKYF